MRLILEQKGESGFSITDAKNFHYGYLDFSPRISQWTFRCRSLGASYTLATLTELCHWISCLNEDFVMQHKAGHGSRREAIHAAMEHFNEYYRKTERGTWG